MENKNLLIDLDNTMVVCNIYYQFAKTNLVKYLKKLSPLSEEEITNLLEKYEFERLHSIDAFSSKTFPEVFLKTMDEACKNTCHDKNYLIDNMSLSADYFINAHSINSSSDKIRSLAESVFNSAPYTIYPTVNETLDELNARGHRLWILTKGDFYTQLRKIQQLSKVFNGVFIVPNKNPDVYSGVVKSIRGTLENTWMIGDSPSDDIIAASTAGLNTVWVKRAAKSSWIGDPFVKEFDYNFKIETFNELLNIFK